MHRKRRLAGLLTAVLLSAVVAGCSTTTEPTPSETTPTEKIASYTQGEVNSSELFDKLISESGMNAMLEMVDKGILDVVEPVSDEMKATVEDNLANVKEYYGEEFEQALQGNGFKNEDAYKDAMFLNLQRNAYIVSYIEKTLITDDAIQVAYDNFTPEVEASHILIKPDGQEDADWIKAEETAKELVARYEAGEAFADLAMEYSHDTGSGAAGGALGSFGKGMMVPEFEQAAYALNTDEHTKEPVKTQFGYHIILKTGGGEKGTFEEMRPEIVKGLAESQLQADESIGFRALVQMREENGFNIENSILTNQYETMKENLQVK